MTFTVCALALLLDHFLGEPRRRHPLVGFGLLASATEKHFYGAENESINARRLRGLAALLALLIPCVGLTFWLNDSLRGWPLTQGIFAALILYFCIGLNSLAQHARAVMEPLASSSMDEARAQVGKIVSRDTQEADATQVARATIESVLENGNDAVFAALFWFVLLGAPGAVLFRAANTLDALWGYRTPRYENFGKAAALFDDALNYS